MAEERVGTGGSSGVRISVEFFAVCDYDFFFSYEPSLYVIITDVL